MNENSAYQTAEKPVEVIGTPMLDKWLRDHHKTGQDIPGDCWGLANKECEENEFYQALSTIRKNLNSNHQEYSAEYRRVNDSILDLWCPIFERIALAALSRTPRGTP